MSQGSESQAQHLTPGWKKNGLEILIRVLITILKVSGITNCFAQCTQGVQPLTGPASQPASQGKKRVMCQGLTEKRCLTSPVSLSSPSCSLTPPRFKLTSSSHLSLLGYR